MVSFCLLAELSLCMNTIPCKGGKAIPVLSGQSLIRDSAHNTWNCRFFRAIGAISSATSGYPCSVNAQQGKDFPSPLLATNKIVPFPILTPLACRQGLPVVSAANIRITGIRSAEMNRELFLSP